MKKITFIFLFTLLLGLAGCNNDDNSSYSLVEEPAIVQFDSQQLQIKTYYGTYAAPGITDATLAAGDFLWIQYGFVDENNQSSSGVTTMTEISYTRIDSSKAKSVTTIIDNYNDSIVKAVLYAHPLGNNLFFGFQQKAPTGQTYDYEMIYNPTDMEDGFPVLYIRSIRTNSPTGANTEIITHYGFDMSDFITQYKNASNQVLLTIKYKTGTDAQGNDVYRTFDQYPISWTLSD